MFCSISVSPTDSPKSTHKHSPSEPNFQAPQPPPLLSSLQPQKETITLSAVSKQSCKCSSGQGAQGAATATSILTGAKSKLTKGTTVTGDDAGIMGGDTLTCRHCSGAVDIR